MTNVRGYDSYEPSLIKFNESEEEKNLKVMKEGGKMMKFTEGDVKKLLREWEKDRVWGADGEDEA